MSDFSRIPCVTLDVAVKWCGNTYGVAPCTASGPVGSECYHGWASCQDKANFAPTEKLVKAVTTGAPLPAHVQRLPHIKKDGVKFTPTEIDPRAGLATRAQVVFTLFDEPLPDHDWDPYWATRATPAQGTFWSRLLARFPAYSGAAATVGRAYFTDGWDDAEFINESYIVESIKGPSSSGEVTITVRDLIKLADRALLPAPTSGKLAVELLPGDMSMTLGTGEGAQYDATGYVRVGDQIIRYTSNAGDVLSWPDSTYRSQFGTTAVTQAVGDGVQQCLVFIDERFYAVNRTLCNESGIADANIDIAGMQAEDDEWLGTRYKITACLSEPEQVSVYLAELAQQTGGVTWLDPVSQKVKYKYIGPQSPAALTGATITREANLVDGQTKIEPLDSLRLTRAGIFYNLATATSNRKEGKNYLRPMIYIDADAEGVNEYNDVRSDVLYSRWFTSANDAAMRGFIKRRVGTYRDVPRNIVGKVTAKDAAIREGELYDVTTAQLTGLDGAPRTVRCLVVKRVDNGNGLDLTLRTTNFSRRYAFIAPNGTSDYPANGGYACICLDTGKFADGSDGYRII